MNHYVKNKKHLLIGHLIFTVALSGFIYSTIKSNDFYFKNVDELNLLRSVYGDNPFTELNTLSSYVKKQIKPNDKLAVFGSEPEVYVYLNKSALSPSIFMGYLNKQHAIVDELRNQFKSNIELNKPDYIYFVRHPFAWQMMAKDDQSTYRFAVNYISRNYKPIAYADQIKGVRPIYKFGADAEHYKPTSEKYIVIFERVNN